MNSSKVKKIFLILMIFLLVFVDYYIFSVCFQDKLFCYRNAILNVVAHPDDDLLFMNPDLSHDKNNGFCITTIFVTAGDAGQDKSYWKLRESGIMAAYSYMFGVNNNWKENDLFFSEKQITGYTPVDDSRISLFFLRLPDGDFEGSGYKSNQYQSLKKLFENEIQKITTVDGTNHYTRGSLIDTIYSIAKYYRPSIIRTQDFIGKFGQGDHSDHYSTAFFTLEALKKYKYKYILKTYLDYSISAKPKNVFTNDLSIKKNTFLRYANYDRGAINQDYSPWLSRQYRLSFSR